MSRLMKACNQQMELTNNPSFHSIQIEQRLEIYFFYIKSAFFGTFLLSQK